MPKRKDEHTMLHEQISKHMEQNSKLLNKININVELLTQRVNTQNGRVGKIENNCSVRTAQIDKLYNTVSLLAQSNKDNIEDINGIEKKVENNTWFIALGLGGLSLITISKQLGLW